MVDGERPLSTEILTERVAWLEIAIKEIRQDVGEIKAAVTRQSIACASTCASNSAIHEAINDRFREIDRRFDDVEADVADNRRRINAWGAGNTILAAVFSSIAALFGGNR